MECHNQTLTVVDSVYLRKGNERLVKHYRTVETETSVPTRDARNKSKPFYSLVNETLSFRRKMTVIGFWASVADVGSCTLAGNRPTSKRSCDDCAGRLCAGCC